MENFWDNRYATDEYVYGIEPNTYLKETIEKYKLTGKILLPGDGEGRNAVFAAQKGFEVTAIDQSSAGKIKAMKLAKKFGVTIDYRVGDLNEIEIVESSFDVAGLVYVHFNPEVRLFIHRKIGTLIKPGGVVILEGFCIKHIGNQKINPNAGGPKDIGMLYTKEMILNDFNSFEPIEIDETEIFLTEGNGHKGMASVIRFTGKKLKHK